MLAMKRREFLKKSALVTGSLYVPQFLHGTKLSVGLPARLVIIQLSGGNDGLNTIVPYRNDRYHQLRPTIALPDKDIISLDDELGFNAKLPGMANLVQRGELLVINGVGYPNPNRSHFRSMDIWHTASDADQYLNSGWLGRYLDANCQSISDAIEADDSLSLILKGQEKSGLAINNPAEFYRTSNSPFYKELTRISPQEEQNQQLNFLYKRLIETQQSAAYVFEKYKIGQVKTTFPDTQIGKRLKDIARFINSGLDSRLYFVNHGGFDTHANQVPVQNRLLGQFDEATAAFINELKTTDAFNNTLLMVFSEFGRRAGQNASNGTDHGTANPVFLIGRNLKNSGIYNPYPSLSKLDNNGDLIYSTDFRSIYATILENWLQVKPETILPGKFTRLKVI